MIIAGLEFLTLEETTKFLGVSKAFIYQEVKKGNLPQTKVARKLFFKKTDLENLFFAGTTKKGGKV